jgi:hypothetical protein
MRRAGRRRPGHSPPLRSVALAGLLLLVLPAAARPPASGLEGLVEELRKLYPTSVKPGQRWRRHATVSMPDGREVPREEAFRDDPGFVDAARLLLSSRAGDDAPLGAWLLGTSLPEHLREVEPLLIEALFHPDRQVAFEAASALAGRASAAGRAALVRAAHQAASPEVQAASAWAAGEWPPQGSAPLARKLGSDVPGLAPGFRRGVSWWLSEGRGDDGRSSFHRLASLGVTWVSIHTWDPLQRGLHEPVLAPRSRRFRVRNLPALVHNAHAAGLAVLFKPHLEMRGYEPTPDERRILRGGDGAARQALVARIEAQRAAAEQGGHNRVAMRSEADWRRWFREYEAYVLPYARQAQAAKADMFCVGRELDATAVGREPDWRRLIARIRREFQGPLVYSANFDAWQRIGFWDALDFIGVSAYFPLSERDDPSLEELQGGWDRALEPLQAASKRWGRPVLLTEAGFPSVSSAARAPWREETTPADVWLQARCYEATLHALAERPWIEGAFFWLWERSSKPPFRDPSHTIVGKPATFTMARWYAGSFNDPPPNPPHVGGGECLR